MVCASKFGSERAVDLMETVQVSGLEGNIYWKPKDPRTCFGTEALKQIETGRLFSKGFQEHCYLIYVGLVP